METAPVVELILNAVFCSMEYVTSAFMPTSASMAVAVNTTVPTLTSSDTSTVYRPLGKMGGSLVSVTTTVSTITEDSDGVPLSLAVTCTE